MSLSWVVKSVMASENLVDATVLFDSVLQPLTLFVALIK